VDSLASEIINGPVSIGVVASGSAWQLYFGGIITNGIVFGCGTMPFSKKDLDHGVVAVGFDDEKWIIRNSWGVSWGNNGYA